MACLHRDPASGDWAMRIVSPSANLVLTYKCRSCIVAARVRARLGTYTYTSRLVRLYALPSRGALHKDALHVQVSEPSMGRTAQQNVGELIG